MHDLNIYETKPWKRTKQSIFQGSERKFQLLTSDTSTVLSIRCQFKVSHSYRIWDVFAQPEVASEVRRTSHFVTSDVVSYPLRYFTIHIPRLSEQVF